MSIASYRENVRKRVTGPNKPTCLPAALEQISPSHRYRPAVYGRYLDFLAWQHTLPNRDLHRYPDEDIEMLETLTRPLGVQGWEDIEFSRATTPLGFARVVRRMLLDERRVVVETTYSGRSDYSTHAIGIIPTKEKDRVVLVSNHVHKCLQGIVTLEQVGAHVAVPKIPRVEGYPFTNANITGLPPSNY